MLLYLTRRVIFPGWGDTGSVIQDEEELSQMRVGEMGDANREEGPLGKAEL